MKYAEFNYKNNLSLLIDNNNYSYIYKNDKHIKSIGGNY